MCNTLSFYIVTTRLQKNPLISPNFKSALEKPDTSCIQKLHVLIARVRFPYFSHTTHALNYAFHIKQNEEEEDKSQECR